MIKPPFNGTSHAKWLFFGQTLGKNDQKLVSRSYKTIRKILTMMDFLYITFPLSGVTTWAFIPPLVAFVVSFFTSMAGVSGAFVLLPFQMSVLNYTAPSVSGTNQLFNIVAIPSAVWRYVKERRMVWPLTWAVIIGTLPGVLIGAWLRLEYLPDTKDFKFFAGFVLLYIGVKLLFDTVKTKRHPSRTKRREKRISSRINREIATNTTQTRRIQ